MRLIITAALATTLAVTGCAGSTHEQASTSSTPAPSEAPAAPKPTSTPSARKEALFLADLAAWPKVDSDTKLAFGNVLCDGLAPGLTPEAASQPIAVQMSQINVAFPTAMGRATRDLCPHLNPQVT